MIRRRKSLITVLTILFLFSLPLIISCAGPDSEKVVEKPSFVGSWEINEDLTGCGREVSKDYTVEITQNGSETILRESENDFIFICSIDQKNVLLCGGKVSQKDGDYYRYGDKKYILRFSSTDDVNDLVGDADWTYYYPPEGDQNNDTCVGNSVLIGFRVNNNN